MMMHLSKAQVLQIEHRLEANGLTYWDIRVEVLDHVVTDIEHKIAKGEPYESAIENAFFQLHLNGNLEALNKSRLLKINKIVRNQYFRKVKEIFSKPASLFLSLLFFLSYFSIYHFASTALFKYFTVVMLFAPIGFGVFLYLRHYYFKQKSAYLIYSSFYIFFSFMMLNIFIQFFQPEGLFPVSKETQRLIWFLVTCINTGFSYAGIAVYLQTKRKILGIENTMKS